MKTLRLSLTEQELAVVIECLGEGKARVVNPILASIQRQQYELMKLAARPPEATTGNGAAPQSDGGEPLPSSP